MKIYITNSVLVGGTWHEPGEGNYEPNLAKHLISLGVAYEILENKMQKMEVKKTPSSASQPARVSRKKTAKKSDT